MKTIKNSCVINVFTSDRYIHLLDGFTSLFNKYWGKEQQVFITGYNSPVNKLPENFFFTSVGSQDEYPWGKTVTEALRFSKSPYCIILFNDYWFSKPIDIDFINYTIKMMEDNKNLGKVHYERCNLMNVLDYNDKFHEVRQTSLYRTSLQPAIWRKEYLQKYLKNKYNPWEFERRGNVDAINDGTLILSSKVPYLVYMNIYLKGELNMNNIKKYIRDNADMELISKLKVDINEVAI